MRVSVRFYPFALLLILLTAAQPATADQARELNVYVPLGQGGALDRFARTSETFLPKHLDARVTVQNFSPKKGQDGFQAFLNSPRDGSSILAWFEPAAAAYGSDMSYDDLTIINVQEIESPILASRSGTGWQDLTMMIRAIRQEPEAYSMSIGGRTAGGSLLMGALINNLGLEVRLASYGSGGKARKAIVAGEADFTAGSLNAIRKLGDKVRPLAVFSHRRLRAWPEVPTIAEALGDERDQAVLGAVYRYFAVHKSFAESDPKAFGELVEALRRMTLEDAEFRAASVRRGVGSHWFGPDDSESTIRRAHQRFKDLIASQ